MNPSPMRLPVHAVAALALVLAPVVAQAQASPVSLGDRLPIDTAMVVEHIDERKLPDSSTARFEQRQQLRFSYQQDQLIATLARVGHGCVGAEALCGAYQRTMMPMRDARYRLAIAPDGQVRLIDGDQDAAVAGDPVAARVAGVVARYEGGAAGAMVVSEVAQLLQFCGRILPPLGEAQALPDGGTLTLTHLAEGMARIRIDRPAIGGGAAPLLSQTEVEIDVASGLVRQLVTSDWIGSRDTQPIRVRTTRLTPAIGPVS